MAESDTQTKTTTAALSSQDLSRLLKRGASDADPATVDDAAHGLRLESLAGPTSIACDLDPPGPLSIGRGSGCDVRLEGSDYVSRQHGRFVFDAALNGGTWFYVDEHSRHGTWLNGVGLTPGQKYPIADGDHLELRPWAFAVRVSGASPVNQPPLAQTMAETPAGSDIRPVRLEPDHEFRLRQFNMLLDSAEAFQRCHRADELFAVAVEVVSEGTGFTNVAVLGPVDEEGLVQVLAQRGMVLMPDGSPRLSRSLIHRAAEGQPVRLSGQGEQPITGNSIAELGIEEAACVPLLVGQSVAGFLYMDRRGSDSGLDRPDDAAKFSISVARLTALAWANLRQQEMQLRFERINADLAAAAKAQRWVLPSDMVRCGRLDCVGRNLPGEHLSGDFFDIIPISEGKIAVVLGDVCGKGVAASIWTTAAQGYIRASLQAGLALPQIVSGLSQYMRGRSEGSLFMSMWLGLIDEMTGVMEYVDAGHGYAFLVGGKPPDVQLRRLCEEGGPLVGIDLPSEDYSSASVELIEGERLVLVSDGVIEQTAPSDDVDREQFHVEGLLRAVAGVKRVGDELNAIFDAVTAHAEGAPLADDATVVLVRVNGKGAGA